MAHPVSSRIGDYSQLPDRSDLRGFLYRAPTRFDFRDEIKKPLTFWQKVIALLRGRPKP
jgi:hypothetical protein